MTVAYSNAVLAAVMPHISDFAAKMELPIPQPITMNQIARAQVLPYIWSVSAGVWLTNHYWFVFDGCGNNRGLVGGFSTATNWFREQEFSDESVARYFGTSHMTKKETIALARAALLKAGFEPSVTHADKSPEVDGPFDSKRYKRHIPFCKVEWQWPRDKEHFAKDHNSVIVHINTETKTVVGFSCVFAPTNHPPTVFIKPSVEPELEVDFRKRTELPMFNDTNAPARP